LSFPTRRSSDLNAINLLVTRHFTLAFKGVADDHHLEVALRSGRHGVHIALIHYIQMLHRQTLGQLLLDTFFHGHLNDSLAWLGRVTDSRSEERGVGKGCRSRGSTHH